MIPRSHGVPTLRERLNGSYGCCRMQRSTRGAATVGVGRSCSPWHPHSSAWAWWRRTDAEVSRACCGLSGCVQLPRKPHGMAGAPRGGRGRAWGELSRCAFFGVNTRLQPSPCKRTVRWPPASPGWLRVSFTFGVFTPIRKLRVQLQAWRPMRGARATVVPFTHFRPHYKRERMKFEVGVPISVSVF